jgi:aryl-alcohol dehydrogenase-like predicted oxidoreductase
MFRVPDASGVLTRKVNEKTIFDKNDHRANRKKEWISEAIKKMEKMKPFMDTKDWDMSQLAIKFILSQKQVSVVLPTVTDIEEIEMFAEMSDGNYLNESELAHITHLYNNNFYVESVVSS